MRIKEKEYELIRISTYARKLNVSVQTIYNRIERGDLKCAIIDGVKFVEVKDE